MKKYEMKWIEMKWENKKMMKWNNKKIMFVMKCMIDNEMHISYD